jgi:hypothetical protein
MKWIAVTGTLAVATLLTALRAAWLWWKASQTAPRLIKHAAGSGDHAMQIEGEVVAASLLNAEAAIWSGATAILSALTAIWGVLRTLPFSN